MFSAVLGVNFLPELYVFLKTRWDGKIILTKCMDFMRETGRRIPVEEGYR
jgi:hypothetical protein|tara:strand:+ start:221 stop:370 length:150 start_codon:yes stop_codon:yes gene_type:complete